MQSRTIDLDTSHAFSAAASAAAAPGTSTPAADAIAKGIRPFKRLTILNLGLAGIQPLLAGIFMSGYAPALTVHAAIAFALQLGLVIQAIAAIVLRRRGRVPADVIGMSIALMVIVFLQIGFGYRRLYWLHVPIGVAIIGMLTRQVDRLGARSRS